MILERQWLHAALLTVLLVAARIASRLDGVRAGEFGGLSTPVWFWLAISIAIAHQVFVWFCWRTQLHAQWLTRVFGQRAFGVYSLGFAILGISRVVVMFILAISNQNTVPLGLAWLRLLAIFATIPAAYLFYSVKRYFTFQRALGIDHFDSRYRSLPFVREGIFRYTRNGMYVFGFLLLWVPALWFASQAALCVAMFSHLYIWVHYVATELPDIRRIYRSE